MVLSLPKALTCKGKYFFVHYILGAKEECQRDGQRNVNTYEDSLLLWNLRKNRVCGYSGRCWYKRQPGSQVCSLDGSELFILPHVASAHILSILALSKLGSLRKLHPDNDSTGSIPQALIQALREDNFFMASDVSTIQK